MDLLALVLLMLPAAVAATLTAGLIAALEPKPVSPGPDPHGASGWREGLRIDDPGHRVVLAMALTLLGAALAARSLGGSTLAILGVSVAIVGLTAIGLLDDREPLVRTQRMALLAIAAALIVWSVPNAGRIVGFVPTGVGLLLLVVMLVGFLRVVEDLSPMDGLLAAAVLPLGIAAALMGRLDAIPAHVGVVGAVLTGCVVGMGAAGAQQSVVRLRGAASLPIAGLTGWMLIEIAAADHVAAAVLLGLYPLAEGSAVLSRRQARGAPMLTGSAAETHRLAYDRGLSEREITDRVLALGLVLAVFAVLTVFAASVIVSCAAVAIGIGLTAALLGHFERGGV